MRPQGVSTAWMPPRRVTIDTVAGDNVINGSEASAGVTVSGTTTAEAGQTVTVTLGGNSYTARYNRMAPERQRTFRRSVRTG